ncbi:SoxR reducing system RseC family protein [Prosthecochloris sp. HL-130-GSB]|jgi:sigma-E factor negative regulatory protein RseC|uniref:SoxR reducing system RseC family protein n=1 Tax=Prosthecochloris sp. HL-130-GSB TaxID=1974213 RepID=UPI000A1C0AAC|nr:SoxR reducing system RseC family protein [Prosthecochloris sp. HL-130-GSB]ARM30775.1 sigma E positive regulator RseC/MucC [Prosthecochloris sp. HL-130-GSB]
MNAKVINAYNGKAEVQLFCNEASAESAHCGACSMGQKPKQKPETILAENRAGAKTGDIVECEIKEYGEIKAATILFIVPLVVFMTALGIAGSWGYELWQSFAFGVVVLAATFLGLRQALKNKTYYYIAGIK